MSPAPDGIAAKGAAQAPFGLAALHRLHLDFSAADWEALQKTEGVGFPGGPGWPGPPVARQDPAGAKDVHRTGQQMDLSLLHPHVGKHPLIDRLLADSEMKARYLGLLKELTRTAFSKERLLAGIQVIEQVTKEPLEREAKAAAARHEVGVAFGPPGGFPQPPEPRTFVEKRTENLG